MVAGLHAWCNRVFSGHDGDPHLPGDHHMCIVSGVTCYAATRLYLFMSIVPGVTPVLLLCSEHGYDEGLSTLGMVSGLFGAFWSAG